MAKLTYLQLTNRVLQRISQSALASGVSSSTGHAQMVSQLINESQTFLFSIADWYSLYTTRTFATVADTAEYAVASDHGRTIDMVDTTTNQFMYEDYTRNFDQSDPDADHTSNPLYFTLQGDNYRLFPIPSGAYTIRERYWKVPTVLSDDSDTSDLPIECENCIILYARMQMLDYLQKYEESDRVRIDIKIQLNEATKQNKRKIDRMIQLGGNNEFIDGIHGIRTARLPRTYPRGW